MWTNDWKVGLRRIRGWTKVQSFKRTVDALNVGNILRGRAYVRVCA